MLFWCCHNYSAETFVASNILYLYYVCWSCLLPLCFSGSHSANLNLLPNGCRTWAWKTLFQLQTPASAQSISGPNASGTITANSFCERMLYPPYCPMKQQRWAFTLCTQMSIVLSCYVIDEPLNIAQIELRKRGVVPKETNTMNKTLTQAEQDRAKEAGLLRREKRSTIRVSFLLLTQLRSFLYVFISDGCSRPQGQHILIQILLRSLMISH